MTAWCFLEHNNFIFFINYKVQVVIRVFYETSFEFKQPKLEPELVLTLSETRCLFRLVRFNIKTTCFGVSIKPKQEKTNRNKPKKRKPKKIFKILNKIAEELQKKLKMNFKKCCVHYEGNFSPEDPSFIRFFPICFKTDQFVSVFSVVSRWIQNRTEKFFLVLRNKPKINQNRLSFGLFWFEPKFFCLFRGHPSFYVAFLGFFGVF
jgi:hypothetical protein